MKHPVYDDFLPLFYLQICALQCSRSPSVSVSLRPKRLGVAALAVDVAVGRVTAEYRIERSGTVAAGEAFLNKDEHLHKTCQKIARVTYTKVRIDISKVNFTNVLGKINGTH